jgi:hypothetical protein
MLRSTKLDFALRVAKLEAFRKTPIQRVHAASEHDRRFGFGAADSGKFLDLLGVDIKPWPSHTL